MPAPLEKGQKPGKVNKIMRINKQKENALIIFAKKPQVGKTKTRIAKETSNKFAYEFTKNCLIELLNKVKGSDYYDLIVVADDAHELSWFQENFSLEGMVVSNKEGGKSEKFEEIFSRLLNEKGGYHYKKVALIPMDIPFISEEDIISAFARLEEKRFVFGPEINGGVYLIGTKAPYQEGVFQGIRWSTPRSFQDLLSNAKKENSFSLKLKNDLNTPEEIMNLKKDIAYHCPVLYKFLKEKDFYLPTKNRYVNFDDLSICIPVALNIVEKREGGKLKILLQARHKPNSDLKNTGKKEVPSGLIEKYELAQNAAIREAKEESGITCEISDEQQEAEVVEYSNGEVAAIYHPFCCHQQLKGDRAYLSLVFLSNYKKGELSENLEESRNPRWIPIEQVKEMVEEHPEEFFFLSLGALREYLKYKDVN